MIMKALRLKLFQETACYKKPFASKVAETYPLPPYSTVKGMIHALLRADRFIPMRLSVQGEYEAKLLDYQRHYFLKNEMSLLFR
ncbi:CRISPR-associated protein [Geobacillus sp. BCO2]|nr:CRISPR-associated protein [Geobacillus sp. BCO2]